MAEIRTTCHDHCGKLWPASPILPSLADDGVE
jgi:hypothetical protein